MVAPTTVAENPWGELLRSLPTLYPKLQGTVQSLASAVSPPDLSQYDLLHFTQSQFVNLTPPELARIQSAMQSGTVILIEVPTQGSTIAQIGKLHYEIQTAIGQAQRDVPATPLQTDLETELTALTQDLGEHLSKIHWSMQPVVSQLGVAIGSGRLNGSTNYGINDNSNGNANSNGNDHIDHDGAIGRAHPLRRQPFLFSQFPLINDHPLYLFNWGSIILMVGDLSSAWCLDETFTLSRDTLRTRQEMGINLLHFAASHRQLTQLQAP